MDPTSPWKSGSRCPGALWGGCGCAVRCESSSTPTPTPSDSPPLASHWSGQQVEQTRDTGKRQGSGQRLMQDMKWGRGGAQGAWEQRHQRTSPPTKSLSKCRGSTVKGLNSGAWISLPGCAITTLRLLLQRAVVPGQAPFETATQPSAMTVWCLGSSHEIIGSHLETLEGGNLPQVRPIGQNKGGREGGMALDSPICTPTLLGAGEAGMRYQVGSFSKKEPPMGDWSETKVIHTCMDHLWHLRG